MSFDATPTDHEVEISRLRREVMVARDALIGAQAEQAVLAARVASLETQVANLLASAEAVEQLVPELTEPTASPIDRVRGRLRSNR